MPAHAEQAQLFPHVQLLVSHASVCVSHKHGACKRFRAVYALAVMMHAAKQYMNSVRLMMPVQHLVGRGETGSAPDMA